jgi:hypothetical protein
MGNWLAGEVIDLACKPGLAWPIGLMDVCRIGFLLDVGSEGPGPPSSSIEEKEVCAVPL